MLKRPGHRQFAFSLAHITFGRRDACIALTRPGEPTPLSGGPMIVHAAVNVDELAGRQPQLAETKQLISGDLANFNQPSGKPSRVASL